MRREWDSPDTGGSIEMLNLDSSVHQKLMRADFTTVRSLEGVRRETLAAAGLTPAEIDVVLFVAAAALKLIKAETAKNERRHSLGVAVGAILLLAVVGCAFFSLLVLPTILVTGFVASLAVAFGLLYFGEGPESASGLKIWAGIAALSLSILAVGLILWLTARHPV